MRGEKVGHDHIAGFPLARQAEDHSPALKRYSRTSLRDCAATASCAHARKSRQIPLAPTHNFATPFSVSQTYQLASGLRVSANTCSYEE